MKDTYEKFAFDYDEFGSIENYLGDEKNFFSRLFNEHNVKTVLDLSLIHIFFSLFFYRDIYYINRRESRRGFR